LGISQLVLLIFHGSFLSLLIPLFLFFTAFNLLEALLPATISRLVPPDNRGAALGAYSSCQFLGIFAGGSLGGLAQHYFSDWGVLSLPFVFIVPWIGAVILGKITLPTTPLKLQSEKPAP